MEKQLNDAPRVAVRDGQSFSLERLQAAAELAEAIAAVAPWQRKDWKKPPGRLADCSTRLAASWMSGTLADDCPLPFPSEA